MIRVDLAEIKGHGIFPYSIRAYGLEGRSRQPLLEACRALKRMGEAMDARQIGLYRAGKDKPDVICSLAWGAEHTVLENRTRGPVFVKWRPFAGCALNDEEDSYRYFDGASFKEDE